MSFPIQLKNQLRAKLTHKKLLTASAASAIMLMAAAPTAHAQVVNVTDCADFVAGVANPGVEDGGATINVNTGTANCVVSSGDHIELEDSAQDDVTINIGAGVRLTNTDSSDEDVVIFIDNAENDTTINIAAGAVLSGANGVIFGEGDGLAIVNAGDIIGTGDQDEGVVYIDRDTDGDLNFIANLSTGRILANSGGPAIGIETLIADGTANAENVGVQDDLADFPTVRIVNQAGGLIQATGTSDTDAINVRGNPGSTNSINRECVEGAAINCIVNLSIVNLGTIRANSGSSSSFAGITIEEDATFIGHIVNRAGGLITGDRNGIRIGDVTVEGEALRPEHDGQITNQGTISGTAASSRGIDLEGDGITIANAATGIISGVSVGIEVGAGSSNDSTEPHSGINNRIINRGTISGGSRAIDSDQAEGVLRIANFGGGVLDGDVRGSLGNDDLLTFRNGASTLTHDVLQDFQVRVASNANLTFDGDRTIEGILQSRGTLTFDLGDTQTVTGNVRLVGGSTVAITDTGAVAAIGDEFTLIEVGGTLFNNATLDATSAIDDSSFLLDFAFVDSNDLVVEAISAGGGGTAKTQAANLSKDISFANATTEAFGNTVLTAFVDGGLDGTDAFSGLANLSTASAVGSSLEGLTPDLSLVQNVFNTVESNGQIIDDRLNNLNCTQYDGETSCFANADSGVWFQKSYPYSSQDSLDLSARHSFGSNPAAESVTLSYGYDHAVNDTTVVGLAGSFTEIDVDADRSSLASTELEVTQVGAYLGHQIDKVSLAAKASYTSGQADSRRQAFEAIESEIDIESFNLQGGASYNVGLGNGFYAKPQVDVEYTNLSTSAFTESGGLDLNIDGTNTNVLEGRVGLTVGSRKAISDTSRADFFVTGAVRNDFYGVRDDIGFAFAGQSGTLGISNPEAFAVEGLAGINILSGENFSFGGAVNGEISDEFNSVGGSVKTKFKF